MKYLTLAVASLFLVACAPDKPDYERMQQSTVFVDVRYNGESIGHGSGVLTQYGVLTAAHVADKSIDNKHILVRFRDGEFVEAELERAGEGSQDVAILRVPTTSGYPLADIECALPLVGDALYVSGNPAKLRWAVTEGTSISSHTAKGSKPGEWLYTDATIWNGSSGGPVFDSRGRVVGLVQGVMKAGLAGGSVGFGRAVSGSVICDFLKRDDDPFAIFERPMNLKHAPGYKR